MKKIKDCVFGAIGIAIQAVSFTAFLMCFVIARLHPVGGLHLPLPKGVLDYTLMPLLISIIPAIVGLLRDQRKIAAVVAMLLILPLLGVMGVLDGNF
jgi:hypothetical protein